jgi:hypothetical protein
MEAINKQQPPNDDTHSGVSATDQVSKTSGTTKTSKPPIIGLGGASIIGIAIIIAGLFVFLGLRGNNQSAAKVTKQNKKHPKKSSPTVKTDNKIANSEEKKELRKKLLTGKINQEMYDEEMKKLI